MEFWNRTATLQIGPFKYDLEGMEFSFDAPFEDSDELGQATIEVKNLSANTRNGIQKGHVVIVNAGYESDMGVIFVGQVISMTHKWEGTEWTTKLLAMEVTKEWTTSQINKTYTRSTKADAVVSDLLNVFGVEVGQMDLVVNKEYPRGIVCAGKTVDVLRDLVEGDCKSRFLIRNGQIFINNPTEGVHMGYLLSPATGLLRCDEDMEMTAIENPQTEGNSNEQKSANGVLKKRTCLLNHRLGPSDIIIIQSRSLNGRFQIVRGKHSGSRSGDWKTDIEVKPI